MQWCQHKFINSAPLLYISSLCSWLAMIIHVMKYFSFLSWKMHMVQKGQKAYVWPHPFQRGPLNQNCLFSTSGDMRQAAPAHLSRWRDWPALWLVNHHCGWDKNIADQPFKDNGAAFSTQYISSLTILRKCPFYSESYTNNYVVHGPSKPLSPLNTNMLK